MFFHYLQISMIALLLSAVISMILGLLNYLLCYSAMVYVKENLRIALYWRNESMPSNEEVEREMESKNHFWYYLSRTYHATSILFSVSAFINLVLFSSVIIIFTDLVPYIFNKG